MTSHPVGPAAAALPLTLLILCAGLSGCAALPANKAATTEQLLSQAGFQKRVATTPDELARLAAVSPQREIVEAVRGGERAYAWVDANYCGCIYAGSPKQYNHFRNLQAKPQVADNEYRSSLPQRQDAILSWGLWGPYFPVL